jgi:chemotaxis methyl-accepting protein methylase
MTSVKQIPRGARYRHVIFNGHRSRRAINLAPVALRSTPTTHGLSSRDTRFLDWLFDQAGLTASDYRSETLHRRLPACLRAIRATSSTDARAILEKNPLLIRRAVGTLVIGVTSFFRDGAVFDHLTYSVLPVLKRAAGRPRIWSAACSDGAEMYSIAILMADMGLLKDSYLLGSDCRAEGIARAREGRYDERSIREVPAAWRERYFIKELGQYRICDELRGAVQWRTADVTRVCEPGMWDLILCRNMSMYLRPAVAGRLWEALENALRPGGFLVLGKAERPIGTTGLAAIAPCIYRRNRM